MTDLETPRTVRCDYLVIGASFSALAFVDAVLEWDKEATFIIVDRRSKPGGNFLDLPSFISLDITNFGDRRCWGVNSKAFTGTGGTWHEVTAYVDELMADFIATGRVQFFSKFESNSAGTCLTSTLDPDNKVNVDIVRKVVDASCTLPRVPRGPKRDIAVLEGAKLVRPNHLTEALEPHPKYTVIGAGQVGLQTVLYLLNSGVSPTKIAWVVPRAKAYWRKSVMFLDASERKTLEEIHSTFPSVMVYHWMLEEVGIAQRLHPSEKPEHMYDKCILSEDHVQQLRRVSHVIRMGYVRALAADHMELDGGIVKMDPNTLYIDCTHDRQSYRAAPELPFSPGRIKLQTLREATWFTECHSAVIMALVETKVQDADESKNRFCTPKRYAETTAEKIWSNQTAYNAVLWSSVDLLEQRMNVRVNPCSHVDFTEWYMDGPYGNMLTHIDKIMRVQHPDVVKAAKDDEMKMLRVQSTFKEQRALSSLRKGSVVSVSSAFDFDELDARLEVEKKFSEVESEFSKSRTISTCSSSRGSKSSTLFDFKELHGFGAAAGVPQLDSDVDQ